MSKKESRVNKAYDIDPLLRIGDASRLLGVHTNTLRRWCTAGLLKEYRIGLGQHRRFRHEDLIALLVEHRN